MLTLIIILIIALIICGITTLVYAFKNLDKGEIEMAILGGFISAVIFAFVVYDILRLIGKV